MIDEADVFQLFWSAASSRSQFVEQEWRYALRKSADSFIRPGYWEEPFPDPPVELQPLHFQRLPVDIGSVPGNQPGGPPISGRGSVHERPDPSPVTTVSRDPQDIAGREQPTPDDAHSVPTLRVAGEQQTAAGVVEQIRTILCSPEPENSLDLAELHEQFTHAVMNANRRLSDCHALLSKGCLAEALQLCESSPPLLDLVALLDFPERDCWDAYVIAQGLPLAPAVQADLALSLIEAHEAARPLADLLRQHRLLDLARAPIRTRLDNLRRLARLDAQNAVWTEQVRELEAVRLREIEQELQQPTLEWAAALEQELKASNWLCPPDRRLVDRATHAHLQLKLTQARQELEACAKALIDARSASDVARGRMLRERWHRLIQDAGLKAVDPLHHIVESALAWLYQHDQLEWEQAAHDRAISELEQALAGFVPRSELDKCYRAVARHQRVIPHELMARLEQRLMSLDRQERRQWIGRVILLALAFGLVLWLVLSAWQHFR